MAQAPRSPVACLALFALSALVALGGHFVGAVLSAPQRALLVAVAYAAGFCTAVLFFAVRT